MVSSLPVPTLIWQLRISPSEGIAPPRPPLGLPRAFSVPWTSDPPPPARASLLPPSLADRAPLVPVSAPPDDTAEARRIRADLLALPAALGADGRPEKISHP